MIASGFKLTHLRWATECLRVKQGQPVKTPPLCFTGSRFCRDQRSSNALIRALSNPISTLPSTTKAGVERTPRLNNSSRASSSIMTSFGVNSTPLLVRYSASAVQGPQKGCEYTMICRSLMISPCVFFDGTTRSEP